MRAGYAHDAVGVLERDDELESVDAVRRGCDLSGGRIDRARFGRRERPRQRKLLARRLEPQAAERGRADLEINEPLRSGVRLAEYEKTDDTEGGEQRGENSEGDEELRLDRRGKARDAVDDRIERP